MGVHVVVEICTAVPVVVAGREMHQAKALVGQLVTAGNACPAGLIFCLLACSRLI